MKFRLLLILGISLMPLVLIGQNRSVYLRNNSAIQFNQDNTIVSRAIAFRGIAPAIVFHQGKYRHQIEISRFGFNTTQIDTVGVGLPDFIRPGETFVLDLGMRYQGDYIFYGEGDEFSPFIGLSLNNFSSFQRFQPFLPTDFGSRFTTFNTRMEFVLGLIAPLSERIRFNVEPHINLFSLRNIVSRLDDPSIPTDNQSFRSSDFQAFNFDQIALYFGFELKI